MQSVPVRYSATVRVTAAVLVSGARYSCNESGDDSIDDAMECDGDYVGPTAVDSTYADDDDCY